MHQHSGSRQPIDALAAECRAAFTRFRLAWLKANFKPDQLRDGAGRWTLVGGSRVVVTRNDRTGHERVDRTSDLLVDELREVSEAAGEGAGPNFGVAVHVGFASRVRELDCRASEYMALNKASALATSFGMGWMVALGRMSSFGVEAATAATSKPFGT